MRDQLGRQMAQMTRRSLLSGGAAALVGAGMWEWVRTRRVEDEIPWPLRTGLQIDEQLTRDYFRETRLAPTLAADSIESVPVNGSIALEDDPDPNWRLAFDGRSMTLAEIRALPKVVITTELRCIEGWSRVVEWGGVRFHDFVAAFYREMPSPDQYVAIETPDGGYYIGLDMPSAMHPQTLLCYEMNEKPLEPDHGAPLRMVIPVKYGFKSLKRVGRIDFSDSRPKDYWAERGYDWYSGF